MLFYDNKLVIYGGAPPRYDRRKRIQISQHPLIYDLPKRTLLQAQSKQLFKPSLRRYHACQLLGSSMLIHGGSSLQGETLSDLLLFDLQSYVWTVIQHENRVAVRSHCCCLAKTRREKQAVFFFGGMDTLDNITNLLYSFVFKDNAGEMVLESAKGARPTARFGASLTKVSETAAFLCGGRNDQHQEVVLRECFVLNMDNVEWIAVQIKGGYVPAYFHGACVDRESILVFGGLNAARLSNATLQIIEMSYD